MLFSEKLKSEPHALALSDTNKEISWQQLHENVLSLREYFLETHKLKAGQHIALLIGNKTEFFEACLAGIISGLWVTPINIHLSPEERLYVLKDCDASLLLYDDAHKDILSQELPCAAEQIESLYPLTASNEFLDEKSPAGGTMIYTSGTTGKPKGVKRKQPEFLAEALDKMSSGAKTFRLVGAGPHLITGPLYHAAPMLFALYVYAKRCSCYHHA